MLLRTIKLLFALFLLSGLAFAQGKGAGNASVSELPSKEKRWALIIGADTYQKDISPLYGTVNDAKALRDVLIRRAGFSDERIILMTTGSADPDLIPTRGNIIDQLNKLQRLVPEDGLILFSFSGHGVSIGNDAFIVPSDGRIYRDVELMRDVAIDVLRIKRAIQATKVKQVIMFLDACRNEPVRAKGDLDNVLTPAYAKGFSFETRNQNIEAYATLYATSLGDRAYEFRDKKTGKDRGYFSYAIEEGLNGAAANDKGEVTLAGLIRYIGGTVKERVYVEKNYRQVPYLDVGGSFTNGDLVIAIVDGRANVEPDLKSGEATYWSTIDNSKNIDDFENYLRRVRNGEFKGIYKLAAELSIAKIKKENITALWRSMRPIAARLRRYDYVKTFSDGLARITLNGRDGFVDKTGNVAIPAKYGRAKTFFDGLAEVNLNGKVGFIDKAGKEIVPIKYDDVVGYSEGVIAVILDNKKWEMFDKTGRNITPPNYQSFSSFQDGLAVVSLNGKDGFMDKTGKEVIPLAYHSVGAFSENLAKVGLNRRFGFIDRTGEEIIRFKYDGAWDFSEGLAGVRMNDKWGFIDKTGSEIIPLRYDFAASFSEGLAYVKTNEKYGFIDKTGREIIPIRYDRTFSFSEDFEGLAKVSLNNSWGYINKEGKEVVPIKYDSAWEFSGTLIKVELKSKYGFFDKDGKEVILPKYEEFWCEAFTKEGFVGVVVNGKKGFVDIYGNEYFDF